MMKPWYSGWEWYVVIIAVCAVLELLHAIQYYDGSFIERIKKWYSNYQYEKRTSWRTGTTVWEVLGKVVLFAILLGAVCAGGPWGLIVALIIGFAIWGGN